MRLLQKPTRKYQRVFIRFSIYFSDNNVFICSKQIRFVVLKIRFCLYFRLLKGSWLTFCQHLLLGFRTNIWQIILRFEVKSFYLSVGLRGSDIWDTAIYISVDRVN